MISTNSDQKMSDVINTPSKYLLELSGDPPCRDGNANNAIVPLNRLFWCIIQNGNKLYRNVIAEQLMRFVKILAAILVH